MAIKIDEIITLELIASKHSGAIFNSVITNRKYLKE